jgi:thiopeptide-type bacteriocin biosynthesis protein
VSPPRFGASSGWVFAKIYTGPSGVERLLREVVPQLVDAGLASGAIDRWFFVRYGDPAWHLRLRLHGPPARLAAEVMPALEQALAPLLADGRILRAAFDTYSPEVNRYGGPAGIELAERLFQIDSEAVLAELADLPGGDAEHRWRLAVVGIDQLLDDLGLPADRKLALVSHVRGRLGADLGAGPEVDRQLGARFRRERLALESLLEDSDPDLTSALRAYGERRERRRALAGSLWRAACQGRLTRTIDELARSHAHMHVNRLLRAQHPAHELRVHDVLLRLYRGRAARCRNSVSSGGGDGAPLAAREFLALHGDST